MLYLSISLLFLFGCHNIEDIPFLLSLKGEWNLIQNDIPITRFKSIEEIPSRSISLPMKRNSGQQITDLGTVWVWKHFYLTEIDNHVLGAYLGKIVSMDETYINGVLIGSTGRITPYKNDGYDRKRIYAIPSHILKQGRNTIAVKLMNPNHNFNSGIYAKKIFIAEYNSIINKNFQQHMFILLRCLLPLVVGIYFLIFARTVFDFETIKYFGLGCIFLAVYIFFYGDFKYLLSDHFIALKKIEYCSLISFPILFLGYIFSLSGEPKSLFFKLLLAFNCFLFLIFLVPGFKNPEMFFLLRVGQFLVVLEIFLGVYIYAKNRFIFNTQKANYIYLGHLTILLTGLNDIFVNLRLINSFHLFTTGVLIYVLFNSMFLRFRLRESESNFRSQSQKFSEIATHFLEIKNFQEFIKSYYNLLKNDFNYLWFAIEIISSDGEKFFKSSHSKLANRIKAFIDPNYQSLEIRILDEDKTRDRLFMIPLYQFDKKKQYRGALFISLRRGLVRERHMQIFRILQTTICAQMSNLDHKLQLQNINQELEKKVRKRTEELNRQFEDLQRLQAKQTTFFASITHDIKTPLSLITMPIETLIKKSEKIDSKFQGNLYKIKYNVYRIIKMLNSVLDIAKFELKQVRTELIPGDIAEFIRKLSTLYTEILNAYELNFSPKITSKKVLVAFDSEKIEKVMDNLLHNAAKHSKPGSKVTIIVRKKNKEFAEIRIQNEGRRLSTQESETIFQPFKQVYDKKGIYQLGSGLGLSICSRYIQEHHGSICFERKVKQKLNEFIIQLPLDLDSNGEGKENQDMSLTIKEPYLTLQSKEMAWAKKSFNSTKAQQEEALILCFLFDARSHWEEILTNLQQEFTLRVSKKFHIAKNIVPKNLISIIILTKEIQSGHINMIHHCQSDQSLKHIPILILAHTASGEMVSQSIKAGAECLVEPMHPLEINLKNQGFLREKPLRSKISHQNFLYKNINDMNQLVQNESKIILSREEKLSGQKLISRSVTFLNDAQLHIKAQKKNKEIFSDFDQYCINTVMLTTLNKENKDILPGLILQNIQKIFPLLDKQELYACSGFLDISENIFIYSNASFPGTHFFDGEKKILLKRTGPSIKPKKQGEWTNRSIQIRKDHVSFF